LHSRHPPQFSDIAAPNALRKGVSEARLIRTQPQALGKTLTHGVAEKTPIAMIEQERFLWKTGDCAHKFIVQQRVNPHEARGGLHLSPTFSNMQEVPLDQPLKPEFACRVRPIAVVQGANVHVPQHFAKERSGPRPLARQIPVPLHAQPDRNA
jgi:hypothetical protein